MSKVWPSFAFCHCLVYVCVTVPCESLRSSFSKGIVGEVLFFSSTFLRVVQPASLGEIDRHVSTFAAEGHLQAHVVVHIGSQGTLENHGNTQYEQVDFPIPSHVAADEKAAADSGTDTIEEAVSAKTAADKREANEVHAKAEAEAKAKMAKAEGIVTIAETLTAKVVADKKPKSDTTASMSGNPFPLFGMARSPQADRHGNEFPEEAVERNSSSARHAISMNITTGDKQNATVTFQKNAEVSEAKNDTIINQNSTNVSDPRTPNWTGALARTWRQNQSEASLNCSSQGKHLCSKEEVKRTWRALVRGPLSILHYNFYAWIADANGCILDGLNSTNQTPGFGCGYIPSTQAYKELCCEDGQNEREVATQTRDATPTADVLPLFGAVHGSSGTGVLHNISAAVTFDNQTDISSVDRIDEGDQGNAEVNMEVASVPGGENRRRNAPLKPVEGATKTSLFERQLGNGSWVRHSARLIRRENEE